MTAAPASATDTDQARHPWGLLLVLSGNMLLDALEVAVLIVALPTIAADLALPLVQAQWLVSGFALGFGGSLLFGRRIVDLLGRRRAYLLAMAGFALASAVAGLASAVVALVAARLVKGFCAALTATTGLAMISTAFPAGRARDRALSVYTLLGASGFSVGLVLSGLLTSVSWRWTLLFPAPVALGLLLAARRHVPRDPPRPTGGGAHLAASAPVFLAGAVLLAYGLVSGPVRGWTDPWAAGALLLGGALLILFRYVGGATVAPLLRAHRSLAQAAIGAGALNGSYWGLLLVLTLHLQAVRGGTPLGTAVALLPASVPLALSAPWAGRVVRRIGAARLVALGAALPLLGYLLALRLDPASGYLTAVLPTLLLVSLGFVLSFAALHVRATEGVPVALRERATATYQTAVQLTGALTVALVAGLLVAAGGAPTPSPALTAGGYQPALLVIAAVGAIGFLVALAGLPPGGRRA
ncbi:putative MFS-type transporter EfpA [Micromonospora sp. MW-13]|uniref:SaqJ n=1 Tax=Micromonospora sp. Tu 6368 TaxID=428986 RepID=C4NYK8_9ACTN|nr:MULTISPECIES: MFS transporter [unclassified Micromonospora]ACP19362.1 SaqJ [Micromonospora sp. Tu 6368]MCX4469498.1 MFS transporter [Micromonospora sp. NBC_01655]RGC65133.1 putative MFS-type transporter EfpA [Micromonospora sp. MW-13]